MEQLNAIHALIYAAIHALAHAMQEYFDFWSRWRHGEHFLEKDHLWGFTMLFWARVGKTAEFVGALTIIIEILGSEKLRELGAWLGGLVRLKSIWNLWRDSFLVVLAFLKVLRQWGILLVPGVDLYSKHDDGTSAHERIKSQADLKGVPRKRTAGGNFEWTPRRIWLSGIAILVGVLVWLAWLPHPTPLRDHPGALLLRAWMSWASLVICLLVSGPLIVSLSITVVAIAFTLLDLQVIQRIARFLDRADLDQVRRSIALVFLVVGFHFDLLTS